MPADADVLLEGRGFRVRRAGPDDDSELCALLRKVHIRGTLDVTQERDPSFYSILEAHLGEHEVWLVENDAGEVGGCGSVVWRPGWVDGRVEPVGYLADLRGIRGFRGTRALPHAYKLALERARDRHGVELFHTVIFDSNELAIRALVRRRGKRRADQPVYSVMTPFEMLSVQFTTNKRPASRVRRARTEDLDALVTYLAERQKTRLMGDVVDERLLTRRFEQWPGFGLDSFFIATDQRGRIVGTLAPWDTHAIKRTRVLGYYKGMKAMKIAFNTASKLFGFTPLPEPGACFRFSFLSHLEIDDDDPQILRDLLRTAYAELRPGGAHFMSAMIPRGSRLAAAFSGFVVNRTPMTVYSVVLAGSRYADRDFRTLHPGFEMALS